LVEQWFEFAEFDSPISTSTGPVIHQWSTLQWDLWRVWFSLLGSTWYEYKVPSQT